MVLAIGVKGAFSKPEVTVNNSPILDYVHPDDHTQPTYSHPWLGNPRYKPICKSGCRTSTRNDRSTRKGDLTQVLLSHALSEVISVRQTFGCVLSLGVTDVFIAHDGLL